MDMANFPTEEEYLLQKEHGALLNPRVDSTFKALFTQPTPESRGALHSFLEASTERKIASFELTANNAPSNFSGQRDVSYDIQCIFDDGMAADIEMQAFSQKYDYGKRAEYQVSRLETTYLKKGDGWEKAPSVYQITVLDFIYSEDSTEAVSRYAMRTKDGRELSNSLNIIFIELPKVLHLEESIESNSLLENWALFLKEADNPSKSNLIRKLTDKEAGLMQAQKSLSSISADRDLWIAQFRQEIAERDKISSLNAARKEGLAQGIEQGMAKGMKQGMAKGMKQGIAKGIAQGSLNERNAIIKRLRAMGLSEEQIALATTHSAEDI